MEPKPKLAMYWAAACGGCEVALLNLHHRFLELDARFDLVFCPCLVDTKRAELRAMPDGSIAVALFDGAIRSSEDEEMAELLRRKARTLVAFGSCACEGCVPGLANALPPARSPTAGFLEGPSLENPEGVVPQPRTVVPEGVLSLPILRARVRTLADVTAVDYFVPGCPPEPHQIWNVIELLCGVVPPPRGAVLGAGPAAACESCPRERTHRKVRRFHRVHELIPDPTQCLLEQGVLCLGPATRDGCGALCPKVGMPCIGCYGACAGVADQGAKMVSALGSLLDLGDTAGLTEAQLADRVDDALSAIPDYVGSLYKFSLAASLLRGAR